MTAWIRTSAILVLAIACACSALYPVDTIRYGAPAAAREPVRVEVLTEAPRRPFAEIARLFTESRNYDSPGHAVQRLREVAAENGADAIVIETRGVRSVPSPGAPTGSPADFGFGPVLSNPASLDAPRAPSTFASAVAIRWLAPEDGEESTSSRLAPRAGTVAGEGAASAPRPASAADDSPFFRPPLR